MPRRVDVQKIQPRTPRGPKNAMGGWARMKPLSHDREPYKFLTLWPFLAKSLAIGSRGRLQGPASPRKSQCRSRAHPGLLAELLPGFRLSRHPASWRNRVSIYWRFGRLTARRSGVSVARPSRNGQLSRCPGPPTAPAVDAWGLPRLRCPDGQRPGACLQWAIQKRYLTPSSGFLATRRAGPRRFGPRRPG